jgi:hypothetical protein
VHRLGEASEQAQEAGRIDEGVMWAIGGRLSAIGDSPAYRRPAERRRAYGESPPKPICRADR